MCERGPAVREERGFRHQWRDPDRSGPQCVQFTVLAVRTDNNIYRPREAQLSALLPRSVPLEPPPEPGRSRTTGGRVHRYKGHAVQKNIADIYGPQARTEPENDDIWATIFQEATDTIDTTSDLVPYWVFTSDGSDAARIERHAPILPISQKEQQLAELKESLAVCRMVFGQPRQDDLVEYLLKHLSAGEVETALADLQIDLSPF